MNINAADTALVLIDLQHGIVNLGLAPRTGTEAATACMALADRFRQADATVVLVRVGWSANYGDIPPNDVDAPTMRPEGGLPAQWDQYIAGLQQAGDLLIHKRQWGAFFGTELDLQLRRRGIRRIVVAGIATNFGVESTVQQGWERGYNVIVAEDGCTSFSDAMHTFSLTHILPRLSHIVASDDLTFVGTPT